MYNVHFILGIRTSRIEGCCSERLSTLSRKNIRPIDLFAVIAHLSDPATEIALVNMVIIIGVFHSCIHNVMRTDIRIIIGHIEDTVIAKILTPAVLTDERTVSLELRIEIGTRIIVIPSDDHNIVIRLLRTDVTIGIRRLVIILGITLRTADCAV